MTLVPQAAVNTEQATVTIVPPVGYRLRDVTGGVSNGDGTVTIERPLDSPLQVSATLIQI